MFDLDDFSWDVDKKADKLNASLFGSDKNKKKLKKPKLPREPKPLRGPKEKKSKKVKPSSIIHDSDDETFTKKDKRKLKERKRKSKKSSEENGEEATNEDVLLFSQASESIVENGIDSEVELKPKSKKKKTIVSEEQNDMSFSDDNDNKSKKNVSFQDDSDVEDKPKKKKRKKSVTEGQENNSHKETNSNVVAKSIMKNNKIEAKVVVTKEVSGKKRKNIDSEISHQTDEGRQPVKKQKVIELTTDSLKQKKKKAKANQSLSESAESPQETVDDGDVDMSSLFDRRKEDWLNDAQSNINSLLAIEQSIKASKDKKKANDLLPVVPKLNKKKKKKNLEVRKEDASPVNSVDKNKDTSSQVVKNTVKVNKVKGETNINASISSKVKDFIKVNNIIKKEEKPKKKPQLNETKDQTTEQKSSEKGDGKPKSQTAEFTKKPKNKKTKDSTPEVKSKENGAVISKSKKTENTEVKTPTKATGISPQQKSQKLKDSKKADILSKMLNESASSAALDEMIESTKKDKQAKMLQPTSDYHMDDPEAEPRSTLPFKPVLASVWGKSAILSQHAKERLDSARFRHLNEQMYTCKGSDAFKMFKSDRQAYDVYHEGYRNQVAKWEVNPLDVIIKQLKTKPDSLVVADFGCGEARLAEGVPQTVHSFDLVALNSRVTACDMSRVPLEKETVDTAVFCLSLMGTNLTEYVREAGRVLKDGGILKIAEVTSRFHAPSAFITAVAAQGFQLLNKRDLTHMFYLMDFKKVKTVKKYPTAAAAQITLKPCLYKRR